MDDLLSIVKEIKSWNIIKPSDDMILDCSVRIFISQNIQREKKEINTEPRTEPATSKQKKLLLDLGYKGNVDRLSKFDASKLINEGIGK